GDVAQVVPRELVDVTLEARLRPAALVVPRRLLVEALGDLVQPAAAQLVDVAALTAHDGDERAVTTRDERHERRHVELGTDAHAVAARKPASSRRVSQLTVAAIYPAFVAIGARS